jgi:beta-glucanase (GH16 family)
MPLRLRGNLLAFSLLAIATGCSAIRSQTSKEFLPPAPDGKQWKLAWHDEFGGQQLDETKWNRLGDWKRRDGYWVKADVKLTEEIGT